MAFAPNLVPEHHSCPLVPARDSHSHAATSRIFWNPCRDCHSLSHSVSRSTLPATSYNAAAAAQRLPSDRVTAGSRHLAPSGMIQAVTKMHSPSYAFPIARSPPTGSKTAESQVPADHGS